MSVENSAVSDKGFPAIRLKEAVTYSSQNFFGRKKSIQLRPITQGNTSHWTWSPDEGSPILIRPDIVITKMRRAQLTARKKYLSVFEHIGPARFGGLVGVDLVGTGWPPYHGRALELWNLVEQNACSVEEELPHYTVKGPVSYVYPGGINGDNRLIPCINIQPAEQGEKRLILDIYINYPDLGEYKETFILPNAELLREICSAHAQGRPTWLYWLARALRLFGLPYADSNTWPQCFDTKEAVLRQYALHRAQDLLGALALLCQDGFFCGRVVSRCSGHRGDILAVRRAQSYLVRM